MDDVAPAGPAPPSSPTKNICGICGSQVTNQGVLDCCQHLFCFTCIDDWASVTNLCPLCNLRFRLITCLPGTAQHGGGDGIATGDGKDGEPGTGGGTSDAEQIFGDGMHPAFYIDEEAVTCLDGNDCLVRSGVSMDVETDSSVACDSCDRWYHAGCVGFDTSGCNQGSWWCPRCTSSGSLNDLGPGGSQLPAAPSSTADFFGLPSRPSLSSAQAETSQPHTGTTVCISQAPSSPTVNPTSSGKQGPPLSSEADCLRSRGVETEVSATKSKPPIVDNGDSNPRKRSRKNGVQPLEDSQTGPGSCGNKPEKRSRLLSAGGEGIDDLLEIVRDDSGRAMTGEAVHEPRTGNGVRTRIIMHRAENNGQSLVEEIRRKMRTEAGYGAAADLGKVEVSDARFLAAYRAAIAGKDQGEEQVRRKAPKGHSWVVKALKNGASVRDNLTRKLYGGLGGRRMWDRDWDVAFWRGNRQNSKSDSSNKLQEEKVEDDADALKIHIADSSLFPRKDESEVAPNPGGQPPVDLNGISRLGAKGSAQQSRHDELPLPDCKRSGGQIAIPGNPSGSGSDQVRKKVRFSDDESTARLETHSGAGNQKSSDRAKVPGTVHDPSNLNVRDKRLWALEVLARKTGEFGASGGRGNTSKGKSLVELLPPELRPSISINIHSKVPSGVRQVQLDRFLEYELKGSGVRRDPKSARCERAVAVAVAKEREIYEKSNSKSVYLNLCANFCATLSARATARKAKSNASLQGMLSESKVRLAIEAAGLGFDSDSDPDCASDSRAKKLAARSLVASESLEVRPSNQVAGGVAQSRDASVKAKCTDANTLAPQSKAFPDNPVALSSPTRYSVGKDHLTLNAESCGSAMLDSLAQESSPLHMDGIFVLDGEELEVPVLSGNATTVQKDSVPKVKVVLTTMHKFKQDLIAVEGGTAIERQENLAQMAAVDDATSSAQADGNEIAPDLCQSGEGPSSGPRGSETLQQDGAETQLQARADFENQHNSPKGSAAGDDVVEKRRLGEMETTEAACLESMSTISPLVKGGQSYTAPAPNEDVDGNGNSKDSSSCQVKQDVRDKQGSAEAESEIDDWMKAGRFPSLESRIDEVRESLLKKGADMLHLLTEYPGSTGDIVDPQGSCLKAESAETSLEGEKKAEIGQCRGQGHDSDVVEKQVHAYVREHLRPLLRSGVISTKDYKWAAAKTVSKVMQHHPDAKSADFLIVEGSKVKKLADDYLKALTMRKV